MTTRVPTYPVLIGIVYAICVVFMSMSILVEMQIGYVGQGEQPRTLGEQLVGVVGFGTGGLVLCLLAARFLSTDPSRAKIGAIVLGILTIPALAFFWCGMPGLVGATAAYLAGLTRGATPLAGAPRVFGIVGLLFAVLNPVVNFLAVTISWILSFI